ncbi:MAG: hypothetical protein MJ198_05065 [Bacteroidales bacterium]|nr:hypothetical protein [Bacteroidales bacterium]
MKRFLIIFIVSILVACCPQKRLNRIVTNHPELAATSQTIMVTVHDTIYIEAAQDTVHIHDTVYLKANPGDVIAEATAGNAKATLIKTDEGVNLAVEQLPDSIPITASANVDVPEVIVKPQKSPIITKVMAIITVIIVLIIKILNKK